MLTTIHGVQFSFIELIAVPGLALLVSLRATLASGIKIRVKAKTTLDLFLVAAVSFLISIGLSWYGAFDQGMLLKAALKWVEVFGIAGIVFLYASDRLRFRQLWWLLALTYLVGMFLAYGRFIQRLSGFDYSVARSLPGYSALYLFALVLPFARRATSPALLFLVASVLGSLTRGAWLGLAAVAVYWNWSAPKRLARMAYVGLLASLLLGAVFLLPTLENVFADKIGMSLSLNSASNKERLGMAVTCLEAFAEHPLTGVGAGNFARYMLRDGVPGFISASNPEVLAPHEFFLQVAAEQGIVGLIAILGVLAALYKILFSINGARVDPYVRALKYYFIVVIVALLFGYVSGETRFTLGLFMGLVLATLRSGVVRQRRQAEGTQ